MPENFRFRTNWRGKVILQRFYPLIQGHGGWQDARSTDMLLFIMEVCSRAHQ